MRTRPDAAGEFAEIGRVLRDLFARPIGTPLPEVEFNALAMRVFDFQFRNCESYGAFCRARGATPGSVGDWVEVPALPTAAFKHLPLVSGDPSRAQAVFRTSGTSRGTASRGQHYVLDLGLYAASLLPPFADSLVPEGGRMPILSLVPNASLSPDSSLSHMVEVVTERFGSRDSATFVDPSGGLDTAGFLESCRRAMADDRPVLLVGTAFAFVHLLDALEGSGDALELPVGSRVMETGGFKGKSREIPRDQMYALIGRSLGIPRDWIVNEYGMTELLSQFYDGRAGRVPASERAHRSPPWLRTRVLDPVSLSPRKPGEPGLLCHFDLANLGSISAILTEDLGSDTGDGLRVLGRAAGAEPRGCSIAMDDLLSAVGNSA